MGEIEVNPQQDAPGEVDRVRGNIEEFTKHKFVTEFTRRRGRKE